MSPAPTPPLPAAAADRSFARDVGSVFGSRVSVLALSLVTSVVLARLLGPGGRGTLAALLVIPTLVVALADMGVKQSAVYFLGQKLRPASEVVSTVLLLLLVTTPVAMAAVVGMFAWHGHFAHGWLEAATALAYVPLSILAVYARGVALGGGQVGAYNRIHWITAPVILISVVALCGWLRLGVEGALLSYLLSAVVVAGYSLRVLGRVGRLSVRYVPGLPQRMLKTGAVYAAASFALQLNYRVDILLVEHYLPKHELGWYVLAANLAELMWQIPLAIGPVLFSRSAAAADPAAFSRGVARLSRGALALGAVVAVGFALVMPVAIPLLYGRGFAPSVGIQRLLLPGLVLSMVFHVLLGDLAGKGRPLVSLSIFLPTALLNVLLNLWWIPLWGIHGVAAASSVSYGVAAVAFAVVYSRITGIRPSELVLVRRADFEQVVAALRRRLRPAEVAP